VRRNLRWDPEARRDERGLLVADMDTAIALPDERAQRQVQRMKSDTGDVPELPEVELVRRGLESTVLSLRVERPVS